MPRGRCLVPRFVEEVVVVREVTSPRRRRSSAMLLDVRLVVLVRVLVVQRSPHLRSPLRWWGSACPGTLEPGTTSPAIQPHFRRTWAASRGAARPARQRSPLLYYLAFIPTRCTMLDRSEMVLFSVVCSICAQGACNGQSPKGLQAH